MTELPGLHLDFETRSAVDLKKAGVYRYAEDATTDVWCCCYALGDGDVEVWLPGQPFPALMQRQLDLGAPFVAHNYGFEHNIDKYVMVPRHGWPGIPLELWDCTALRAAALALPRALDNVAKVMRLDQRKDVAGKNLMLRMSRPVKDSNPIQWYCPPGALDKLIAYCKQDVVVERAIDRLLRPLSAAERGMMTLDSIINGRGFKVDIPAVRAALAILEDTEKDLNRELKAITSGAIQKVSDLRGFVTWLEKKGTYAKSLDKDAVEKMLKGVLDPDARRVLEIRQQAGYTSTKKLTAMLESACADGRCRGQMMFLGAASTGRWSGTLVQPHNLPRGTGLVPPPEAEKGIGLVREIADAFPAILTGNREAVEMMLGPPHQAISDCVRGFIVAETGKKLVSCDYTAVEAKITAVEAGQQDAVQVFLRGDDIYKYTAAQIYNIEIGQVSKDYRQVGKVANLALGYQGGVGAFSTMAKAYRLDMATAYDSVMSVSDAESIGRAEESYQEAAKEQRVGDLSDKAFIASDLVKRNWRARNQDVVNYWYACETAAMEAVLNPNVPMKVRNVTYMKKGPYLYCRLASGRVIVYPEPKVEVVKTRWNTMKEALTYIGPNKANRNIWGRQVAYGGLLVENIVQATAASVIRDGLRNLEAAGFPVVLHVHDEAVTEIDDAVATADTVEFIEELMTMMPPWMKAAGWPKGLITAKADGPLTRYRK